MRRILALSFVMVAAFTGCPVGSGDGGENAKISELMDYCPQMCLKFQECNSALFALKWNSLADCEKECDPRTEANTCCVECDNRYAAGSAEHQDCFNVCRRDVDVEACKTMCDGISDEYYHNACITGCNKEFSQACADVHAGIHECYLGLGCERAIIYHDFGGSASDLGECTNDDAVGTNC